MATKLFFTFLLSACFFTFATIAIAVIRAYIDSVITSETEDKIKRLCAWNMLLAGICWCITFVYGIGFLVYLVWR